MAALNPNSSANLAPLLTRVDLQVITDFAAPRGDIEQALAACWRDVLGIDRIGALDDFFSLGGTSLQAVEIFAQMAKRFGITPPLSTLYRAPTIRALATELGASKPAASGRAVPLQASGTRKPLFVVPGIGGGVVGLAYLARALGSDLPVFGLESRGLNEGDEPLTDMRAIAEEFVRDLRRVQPAGPYRLMGICWGAIAALEIARQLRADGEEVSALLLLDPPPPGTQLAARTKKGVAGRESVPQFIASRLKLYRQTLRQLPASQRRAFVGEKLRMLMEIVQQRDLFRGDASELRRSRVLAANRQAARRYTAKAADCPVHLVFTAERADGPSRAARTHWLEILSPATPPDSVPGSDTGDAISADRAHHVAEVISRRLR